MMIILAFPKGTFLGWASIIPYKSRQNIKYIHQREKAGRQTKSKRTSELAAMHTCGGGHAMLTYLSYFLGIAIAHLKTIYIDRQ
ncbi:unnamed protein product [Camellia sinensis]